MKKFLNGKKIFHHSEKFLGVEGGGGKGKNFGWKKKFLNGKKIFVIVKKNFKLEEKNFWMGKNFFAIVKKNFLSWKKKIF